MLFVTDLWREHSRADNFEFMAVSSYGSSASGVVRSSGPRPSTAATL